MERKKVPGIRHLYEYGSKLLAKQGSQWIALKAKKGTGAKPYADAEREIAYYIANDAWPVQTNVRCRDAWPEIAEAQLALGNWTSRTYTKYEQDWRLHCKILHPLRVGAVDSTHIKQVLDAMGALGYENRKGEGKTYAAQTIIGVFTMLSSFFTTASRDPFNYCTVSPCEKLGLFRPKRNAIKPYGKYVVLSEDETDALALAARTRDTLSRITEEALRLTPNTGMRLGETLGLLWSNVDLELGQLTLTQKLTEKYIAEDPSTWFTPLKGDPEKHGGEARIIPLLDEDWRRLRAYKTWLFEQGLLRKDWLVFTTRNHTPIHFATMQKSFNRAIERAGITREERKPTFHWLRHTYASRMFQRGVPMDDVSSFLGHSTTEMTRKRYVHLLDQREKHEAVRALFR